MSSFDIVPSRPMYFFVRLVDNKELGFRNILSPCLFFFKVKMSLSNEYTRELFKKEEENRIVIILLLIIVILTSIWCQDFKPIILE